MRAIASLAAVAVAARFFGASIERDAWLIAFTAQAVFLQLAFGPVNEIFRAKFVHVAEAHSFEHAFAQLAEWVTVTVIACVAGAGLAWLWSAPLGHALAPGFAPERVRLVGSMIALGLPVVAFQQIANLWTSALNASGRYYLPDVASIGSSLVQILLVVACAPAFGIYSLFVALYAASLVLCVVLWWSVRRERGFVLAKHPSWPTLRVYSGLSSAFVLPTALAQISALVERALCSLVGPGTVSVLDYARRFVDFPQGVVLGVTQTVVTPQLARHGARDEADPGSEAGPERVPGDPERSQRRREIRRRAAAREPRGAAESRVGVRGDHADVLVEMDAFDRMLEQRAPDARPGAHVRLGRIASASRIAPETRWNAVHDSAKVSTPKRR